MILTNDQKIAVEAAGSVAVTAGAGTGKTAMLAARYLHHVVVHGFSPLEVVAVTFTDKAAAELRSRIRSEMQGTGDEIKAAEVDAAQISTIHALAARICRDFYGLVRIPADFQMLDEIDAEILMADWFDDAMAEVDPSVVRVLGYTWLRRVLRLLMADPFAAEDALRFGEAEWKQFIAEACERAIDGLIDSDCWQLADQVFRQYTGGDNDPAERRRLNALIAMEDIRRRASIGSALDVLKGFATNHGSAARWPNGGLTEVRSCLIQLRDAFKACKEMTTLAFGPADLEASKRVELLRKAFETARNYIAKTKLEKKVLDFGDLEMYALEILKSPAARKHYAVRWKAILVDEFQDTNPVQEKLLERLTENVRLTIVGDVKQSVYGFRRADTRVFDRFRMRIGNEVILSRTFRSHAGLVEPMNRIFGEVLGTLHQPLEGAREESPHEKPFVFASAIRGEDKQNVNELRAAEAQHIADEIGRMLDRGLTIYDKKLDGIRSVAPGDIAILSRTRAPLETYIDALLEARIPAVNIGGGDLLETREAKDAMAVLQFAADPADDIALMTLLRGPFFALSDLLLYKLSKSKERDESWWSLLSRADGDAGRAYSILNELLKQSRQVSAERLIEITDEMTGYTAVIANLEQGERRLADWFGFLALLRRFASLGRADVLGATRYLNQIHDAHAEIPRPPLDAGDAVSLMTIHGSKGLEWPIVFIPDLARPKPVDNADLMLDAELGVAFEVDIEIAGKIERLEPAILTLLKQNKKKREVEEAKRILYVAITRARDRVYLTSAGEKGPDLELLRPGLEAAGIAIETIDHAQVKRVVSRMPQAEIQRSEKAIVQTERADVGLTAIPVTGLSEYGVCPKRFKFQFVDGHPGLAEGSTGARITGALTHTALERGCTTAAELTPLSEGASAELIDEALLLAGNFGREAAFGEFRIAKVLREVPLVLKVRGVTLSGTADLVGDEFVLDFKTDNEVDPRHHRLQLWAYKKALGKTRAVVAYLRHGQIYEFSDDEMKAAEIEADSLATGIEAGRFSATPGEIACARCAYRSICSDAVVYQKVAEVFA